MILSKVSKGVKDAGRRIIKTLTFGKTDVRESWEASPYGWDSCPIENIVAVYSDTSSRSDNVVIGYITADKQANPGECRMFATGTDGSAGHFVYVQRNRIVIGEGNPSNHFTQWEALNLRLQAYLTNLNAAISTGITGAGGVYVPPASLDITAAKTNKILTN